MIRYTITSGTPTEEEKEAIERALKEHERPYISKPTKSRWAAPALRSPLGRKR